MGVMRILAHSLSNEVGMGSSSQDFDGVDFKIFSKSSSDTGLKKDRDF